MNEQLITYLDKYGLDGNYYGGDGSGRVHDFTTQIRPSWEDTYVVNMGELKTWVNKRGLCAVNLENQW